MSTDLNTTLQTLQSLTGATDVAQLANLGHAQCGGAFAGLADDARHDLVRSLVAVVDSDSGTTEQRLAAGVALGLLGDPRLNAPADDAYWARVTAGDGEVMIGRNLVTNAEFQAFVDAGGYTNDALWSEDGRAWRDGAERSWPALAASPEATPFVVPNQPVVGVTWYEASAYATWAGARLPEFEERLQAVRGTEKRPYPWGSPFGEGNANTQEEVVQRPVPVGLFRRDRTPEGVCDLAGNAAEWCADGTPEERWVHPGAWDQPSLSAWAKARELEPPTSWSPALGFRLAKSR
ncbi:MAG: formylglycine-generating enzyme family protein [Myxococcota bacterium]